MSSLPTIPDPPPARPPLPTLQEAPEQASESTTETVTSPRTIRFVSSLLFGLCAVIIGLAMWMTPSPKGIGTHAANFYLPPCGMYITTGYPCPTCGCTTAVAWLYHGHLWQAFYVQPFGAVFGLATLITAGLSLVGILTGRWIGPQPFTIQWHWRSLLMGATVVLLLGWGYKICMILAYPPR